MRFLLLNHVATRRYAQSTKTPRLGNNGHFPRICATWAQLKVSILSLQCLQFVNKRRLSPLPVSRPLLLSTAASKLAVQRQGRSHSAPDTLVVFLDLLLDRIFLWLCREGGSEAIRDAVQSAQRLFAGEMN
jgi:hypothetical protein